MIQNLDSAIDCSLQTQKPQLFSNLRRNINSLREKDIQLRKGSILQLLTIVKTQKLSVQQFQQITHMCLKQCLKCFADHSQTCRQNSVKLIYQLLTRCSSITTFLPYIFSVLIDRTNCYDLQGIQNVPEKMRPTPGQKPKMLLKLNETCEEIRVEYCNLLHKIISLADENNIRKHLDDIINIMRALIMDPSPQIQKTACDILKQFCDTYRLMLLHYTQIMGRAVLLPLVSKKSKIRIAGLQALTSIFWCGLWKYNAFVFQNLIGFKDPNSVPIKDFYQPSHNVNYLATFIIDSNAKVRFQFLTHLKIWVCDLDDKYDHHGKLVPYLLSGLFDSDEKVAQTANQAIIQIGRQIQIERQKDFRQNKQFAIDAAWTWQGKLADLPLVHPLQKRPSLGSRFFIRGHVRKMWTALYKQVKDINFENRMRAASLALLGVIFTQNYLTQFLDHMIPEFVPCLIPHDRQQQKVSQKIVLIFKLIGRYCAQSAYYHIIKAAINGQLVQNQQFVKGSMKALSLMILGSFEAIPQNQGLSHKKKQIIELLQMLNQINLQGQIYHYNCKQAREVAENIVQGLKSKATRQELNQILSLHYLTILKILAVSYYEEYYSTNFALNKDKQRQSHLHYNQNEELLISKSILSQKFIPNMNKLQQLYPSAKDSIQEYLTSMYQTPPSLLDADWKMMIVLHNYKSLKNQQQQKSEEFKEQTILYSLLQDVITESLTFNRSVEILNFLAKYISYLISCNSLALNKTRLIQTNKILCQILKNFKKFKPIKKVPIYDQHLVKEDPDPNVLKMNEDTFILIFKTISNTIASYYLQKLQIQEKDISNILFNYLEISKKVKKHKQCNLQSIKTVWVIFQRSKNLTEQSPEKLQYQANDNQGKIKKQPILPVIIDFLIERLQIIQDKIDPKKISMIFSVFNNLLKCFPLLRTASEKLPNIYPNYPQLVELLAKYTLNEKDNETREKHFQFLSNLCRKMPAYFKFEANMAQQSKRFQRAKLLKEILHDANIQ